jgi:hypothetical protein
MDSSLREGMTSFDSMGKTVFSSTALGRRTNDDHRNYRTDKEIVTPPNTINGHFRNESPGTLSMAFTVCKEDVSI